MKVIFFICSLMSFALVAQVTHFSQAVFIEDDDWSFAGSENILLVPENRNNPDSRMITLHFFHFPAKDKSSDLAPVAFLGAGPGEPYSVEVFYNGRRAEAWRYELEKVNEKRDVLLINQRGNPKAPGLQIPHFSYKWWNGGSLGRPFDLEVRNQNRRLAYQSAIDQFTQEGIDLRGYDMMHFVDDIEEVRNFLGAEKLALIANSFGSQWGLSYIQKYTSRVDRAIFSGVEPVNNNYDDPQDIWKILEMIGDYSSKDSIAVDLPRGGIMEAFMSVIKHLEEKPEEVEIEDENGEEEVVVVGADDLRFNLMYPEVRTYAEEIEAWPKYIMEMYNGDYTALATMSRGRMYNSSNLMINPLVNNSLGITKEREALLESRPAARWLGDINAAYTQTAGICPAPKVSENFLKPLRHNIPIILIQGDMDMSTPYQNAVELMKTLENGHLLTVKRGFHNAKRALIFEDQGLADQIFEFMDMNFEKEDLSSYYETLTKEIIMPEFKFRPIGRKSLSDE